MGIPLDHVDEALMGRFETDRRSWRTGGDVRETKVECTSHASDVRYGVVSQAINLVRVRTPTGK